MFSQQVSFRSLLRTNVSESESSNSIRQRFQSYARTAASGHKRTKACSGVSLINCATDTASKESQNVWNSHPAPQLDLWGTDFEREQDWHLLDRVKCHVWIELTELDNKGGKYEGRMTCFWMFRTARLQETTQPRMRAPGLRAQRLVTKVIESRVWRTHATDTPNTVFWKGTSIITFSGYEIFEVHDFPFDRQILDLDVFQFVWRPHKDCDTFEESMKVVHLSVATTSMLQEWKPAYAIVTPKCSVHLHQGPSYASHFTVKLRLERIPTHYVWQVFTVTFMILTAALLPLGLKPGDVHIGDRMALHCAGLLTMVAFKYSVQADLPVVPYWTFASAYLTAQIITIALIAIEGLFAYKCIRWGINPKDMDNFEDIFLILAILSWGAFLLHCAFFKKPTTWKKVVDRQDTSHIKNNMANCRAW